MSFLERLTDDEASLLIQLPYRVGLYISLSDSEGGVEAKESEMAALCGIVEAFATQTFGCETVQKIITKTLHEKDNWDNWASAIINVPEECSRARSILLPYVGEKELSGFANQLLDIAQAVAIAFCERGKKIPIGEKISLYFSFMMEGAKKSRLSEYSIETFSYISNAEKIAIKAVARAFGEKG